MIQDPDEIDTQPDVPTLLRRKRVQSRSRAGLAVFGFLVILRVIYESASP